MRPLRVRELTIQYRPHPSGAIMDQRTFTQPSPAAAVLRPMLENQAQEVFIVLLLNTKLRLIAAHDVARGGINSAEVDPRIIFRAALLANAPAIILGHNHPSGDPSPSPDDCTVTRRIQEGGKILGIELIDHVIIGDQSYCSFRETGRL